MDDSVLLTIKKLLGVEDDYTAFDGDILVGINSALFSLSQLGVVPPGTRIDDSATTWTDIITGDDIEGVKTYIHLKTKIIFDPPTSSFVLEALTKQLNELEWRLLVQIEQGRSNVVSG